MLDAIHSNPLIALTTILVGTVLGLALALSDWKSKFTIGGILAAGGGAVTSITAEKVAVVKAFLDSTALLNPLLYGLDIALVIFLLALGGGTAVVFLVNYLPARRKNSPEAFVKAARRGMAIFGSGLYRYVTAPPELDAANKIRDLQKHRDVLCLVQKTLVREIAESSRSVQHFKDSVDAIGRLLLQYSFDDSAELDHYRIAFFERRGDRLEYMVAVNNRDWTAHSMSGFELADCLMGEAIRRDRPLVYPRDKKRGVPYAKRKSARYKSFAAVPVPCGQSIAFNVGAMTVDYTGRDTVFTDLRIDELFAVAQLVYSLYLLNVRGDHETKKGTSS